MQNDRYPDAYEAFLYEFHATRDYFECHERLEDYWKKHPEDGFGDTWVGLIQLAVGAYHQRRGNQRGAAKMFLQAGKRLNARQLAQLGLDGEELLAMIGRRLAELDRGEAFTDMELPIRDALLLERLQAAAARNGLMWAAASGTEEALVDRHTLRDRSEVIAARAAAAAFKRNGYSR